MLQSHEVNSSKTKNTLGAFLMAQKTQIAAALPKHLTADRMLRIAMTEIRKVPALKECSSESLISSIIQASQLGLEPGGSLGHCYLIPYERSMNVGSKKEPIWKKVKECQFMLGYRGMIELARRSGNITTIYAQPIHENDSFTYHYGMEPNLNHVPARANKGEIIGAYAIAKFKDGGFQFEVMWKDDIEKIRARSKAAASTFSPWTTDYAEMARKTVVRRLFKYLPTSIEIRDAVTLDDAAEEGKQIIEGNWMAMADEVEMGVTKKDKEAEFNEALNKAKPIEKEEPKIDTKKEDVKQTATEFFGKDDEFLKEDK